MTLPYLLSRCRFDPVFRKKLGLSSLFWFVHVYFGHYVFYETADFHRELYDALQDQACPFTLILAFRGSSKTTAATTILPIYAMLAHGERYTVLIGDTEEQSKLYLHNVKIELETNDQLKTDFGPFEGADAADDWRKTSLYIPKYQARIACITDGQSVRGLREQERRPGLVIADDLENVESVRQKAQRDKRYRWLKQDVMGVGDLKTRFILIGNLLHADSLIMRLKNEITSGKMTGRVLEFPFTVPDGNGGEVSIWPGKFPDAAAIEREKTRIGDERTWLREYKLKIVAEDGQEVREEWIKRYDQEMIADCEVYGNATGVDLAISKKETADFTAMVSAQAVKLKTGEKRILIMPNPINLHLSFKETIDQTLALKAMTKPIPNFYVEDVQYQRAAIETMENEGVPVTGVKITADKRARLRSAAKLIQQGTVLFPLSGCEDLLIQVLYFGTEAHDDLVDAMVYAINGASELMSDAVPFFV